MPVVRLAGGRAAAFHEGTLAIAWASPARAPVAGTRVASNGSRGSSLEGPASLGVDARMGELPREYCPGAWSVNARGRTKLAGIGQRLIAGGAHPGGVIVVGGSRLLREALVPITRAGARLGPGDRRQCRRRGAGVGLEAAEEAILAELEAEFALHEAEIDPDTLALAERLEQRHLA